MIPNEREKDIYNKDHWIIATIMPQLKLYSSNIITSEKLATHSSFLIYDYDK